MNSFRATLIGLLCAVPALCFAQWQWIDKDGRKVFSDQSPPAEIPAKNILRQPGVRGTPPAATEAAQPAVVSAAQPAAAQASAPKLSGKDKELDEKRKAADAVAAEKKKAQEEERQKLRAENCARAKRSKASLDSGVRISQTNDKGEREFLDDAGRVAETKRMAALIASECAAPGG